MASLSLQRVYSRKTSLEIERESFIKSQAQALSKAINNHETPVKTKHVRSAIIGTFHTQGAKIFWSLSLRLPAMDDRITAWKLCHVVHKILREGHPMCLVDSQRHRHDLDEIGKLWVHLKEGYGKMIRLYTTLLITKLDFHRRNPRFPGHLGVTPEELDAMGGDDISNEFQLSVEMFDYLDAILDLQAAIFGSLDMARSNSMTSAGQCRLAPLIQCIQDASKLYDYCVKIMFKLHNNLKSDLMGGHRQRFLKQFKMLKQFYQNANNLQYFKDLINILPLPEHPPNFQIQSEFRTYVTQEVIVPQEPEEEVQTEGSLIDTSDVIDFDLQSRSSVSPGPMHQELISERDLLRTQCEKLRGDITLLLDRNERHVSNLRGRVATLETELTTKDTELHQERQAKEELINQAFTQAQVQHDSEEKTKLLEKFNKLREFYYKVRGEHIENLRVKDDIAKKLAATQRQLEQAETNKAEYEQKIAELGGEVGKIEERLQKSTLVQLGEIEELKRDKELFNMEIEIMKKSVFDAQKQSVDYRTELTNLQLEKTALATKLDEAFKEIAGKEDEIVRIKTENDKRIETIINTTIENCKAHINHAIDEIDNPALIALTSTPDYLQSLAKKCHRTLELDAAATAPPAARITTAIELAHNFGTFLVQGRATGNRSPDINFGDKMADECKLLGGLVARLLECVRAAAGAEGARGAVAAKLGVIEALTDELGASLVGANAENLVDLLEGEMIEMDKAIEEAANRIQEMLRKSREADSGIKLEVNSKLLDSCTSLMQAIRVLVAKSRLLQAEIVAQGRGTATEKEFYKRNHQWTDGFISAAKAVATAAKFLLTSADKVVTSNGKLEQLVAASREIAASTAQLVVASRVKADRHSNNLKQLTNASNGVATATSTVIATVKDCSQLMDETEELDTSNLTLHKVKQLEMETQVRVLELEKELEQERYKLSSLRKHHYQLAGEQDS